MKTAKYHHLIEISYHRTIPFFWQTLKEGRASSGTLTRTNGIYAYLPWSDNLTSNFYQNISDL